MKDVLLASKYPIHMLELSKDETPHASLDELLRPRGEARSRPAGRLIAVFDHYAHTTLMGGRSGRTSSRRRTWCSASAQSCPDHARGAPALHRHRRVARPLRHKLSRGPMPEANEKMVAWVKPLRRN